MTVALVVAWVISVPTDASGPTVNIVLDNCGGVFHEFHIVAVLRWRDPIHERAQRVGRALPRASFRQASRPNLRDA
ncbi:MAG: hypothetical protein ACSLFB_06830 [Acidimicrobiales bacterium]